MKRMLLIAALMLGLTTFSQAQEMPPNSVSGFVLDSLSQKALTGIDVTIVASGLSASIQTNDEGGFCLIFRNYPESGYVFIKKKGYISKQIEIPKGAGNGCMGDILLVQGDDKPKKKKR